MNKVIMGCFVVAMLAVPSYVMAFDNAAGTLTVTGTVVSSITVTLTSAGGTFSGGGTSAATSALGSISKFGAPPTGFTKTNATGKWTLASNIGVKVQKANSASATFILNAKLGSLPATNVIWTVGGFALNSSTDVALTATGAYDGDPGYVWLIEIPDSMLTATAIDNVITFSAISN
jgi:hypothetical protein